MSAEGTNKVAREQADGPVPEASQGVTRREFLKGLGVAAIVAAAPRFASVEGAGMNSPERERVYEKGIVEMRLEARMNPREQQRMFVDDGRRPRWMNLPEGNSTSSFIPFEAMGKALADRETRVAHFHTHPRAGIERVTGRKGEEAAAYTMPPSLLDFTSLITLRRKFGDAFSRVVSSSLDERGIWEYSMDESHPVVQEFFQYGLAYSTEFNALISDPDVKLFLDSRSTEDPRSMYSELMQKQNEFSPKSAELIRKFGEEMIHATEKIGLLRDGVALELKGCILPTKEAISARIEASKKLGLTLSFTPFEK